MFVHWDPIYPGSHLLRPTTSHRLHFSSFGLLHDSPQDQNHQPKKKKISARFASPTNNKTRHG